MAGTLVVDTINTESNANLTLNPGSGNVVVEGNLNVETNQIATTASNRDIELAPHGTGAVEIRGNTNPGTVLFNCENNSHAVTVRGPAHSASATYTLTLPTSDGNANECLISDGSGVTSWSARAAIGAVNMDKVTSIHVNDSDYNTDPTGLNIGTSGLFVATTAAPTDWHSDFKHPGGQYTEPTAFPAVAPWYVNAANSILVGTWTQCGT